MHATKCLDEAGVVGGVERVVGFGDARVPRKAQVFHEDGEATTRVLAFVHSFKVLQRVQVNRGAERASLWGKL